MNKITVITPTYNRGELLKNAYNSLINQSNTSFEWLIIDDGSNDNTKQIIDGFISEDKIIIKYIFKENAGKHTALNIAFDNLKTDLAIILDSDDCLSNNAIETILRYWEKYKNNPKICGIVFLKGISLEKPITKYFKKNEYIGNYNTEIINNNFIGDKAEVFKTDILKQNKFPEYKEEKFLGEGFIWSKISRKYDMAFINEVIYICEYLENGLTKSGRKLRINNPLGGMKHAEEYTDNKIYSPRVILKNKLLYNIYYLFAKEKYGIKKIREYKLQNKYNNIIINLVAFIIYKYWKRKYK